MVECRTLKNGARLIMDRSSDVRSAAVGIWVGVGASGEWDQVSGISHYIEHMLFKGTEKRSARQIAEDVDRIGGVSNAFTGKEATCYYIKTLSSSISRGAEILIDMLTASVFDEEELDRERKVILEEIKMVQDAPDEDVMDKVSELVGSGNPIGRSILGTPESLSGIGRAEITDFYRKQYSRDSIVVAAAGNFDAEELTEQLEEGLAVLNAEKDHPEAEIKPYVQSFHVKVRDIEQTHICLACPSVSLGDDLYYAMVLMNNIFGGSMSSRLFQNIREQRGLAYSVASMNSFSSRSGFFNIYAGISHEKAQEAIEAIRYELNLLKSEGVSQDELDMAREQVKSSYIFGLESVNTRMFNLGKNQLLLNRYYDPDEVLKEFDRVSRAEIAEAAAIIAEPEEFCGAAVTGREFDLEGMVRG